MSYRVIYEAMSQSLIYERRECVTSGMHIHPDRVLRSLIRHCNSILNYDIERRATIVNQISLMRVNAYI